MLLSFGVVLVCLCAWLLFLGGWEVPNPLGRWAGMRSMRMDWLGWVFLNFFVNAANFGEKSNKESWGKKKIVNQLFWWLINQLTNLLNKTAELVPSLLNVNICWFSQPSMIVNQVCLEFWSEFWTSNLQTKRGLLYKILENSKQCQHNLPNK